MCGFDTRRRLKLKCQSNMTATIVFRRTLCGISIWTRSSNECVMKHVKVLRNSEEITAYSKMLLTLFVGDKSSWRCGGIQISGSGVLVSVSASFRGPFYLPSCIKSSRITVLKELWNLLRHLKALKQLVSASLISETHTGQSPSRITRREPPPHTAKGIGTCPL